MRPKDLVCKKVVIRFNKLTFKEVEIDILHINKYKNATQSRPDWTAGQVIQLLCKFVDGKNLKHCGRKGFGLETCYYYKLSIYEHDIKYRLIFCICSDKPRTIGLITFFQEKK